MTRLLLLILALSLTSCMSGSLKAPAKPAAVPAAAVVTGQSYPGVTLWYPTSWGNIESGAGNAMRYYSSLFSAKCYQGK
jgi:curli biogenesis system outer membrane secretion channel CsgG